MNEEGNGQKNIITVFADGASLGNPGPGGWGAVVIQSLPPSSHISGTTAGQRKFKVKSLVTELGGMEKHTTNNRMELTAVIQALKFLSNSDEKNEAVKIHTDSSYVINGITKWIFSWERRNWITKNKEPVLNKDLWEELLELTRTQKVGWIHVAGHSGIPGNDRADKIASEFAVEGNPKLFSGDLNKYKIKDIFNLEAKIHKKKSKSKTPKNGYYVSKVDGTVMVHKTWEDCKKRVLSVKGAKFKKVSNKDEENKLIESWG